MRKNMKAERARAGLSAVEVAKIIGVHENTVLRWENEDSEPMGSNLIELANLYGCTPEYLLDLTDRRKQRAFISAL